MGSYFFFEIRKLRFYQQSQCFFMFTSLLFSDLQLAMLTSLQSTKTLGTTKIVERRATLCEQIGLIGQLTKCVQKIQPRVPALKKKLSAINFDLLAVNWCVSELPFQ